MKLHKLAPMALIALTVTVASAQGFYVLGEVTHSTASLDGSSFDSQLTLNGASSLSSSSNGNGNKWRLQGGYQFSPNLAVEGGYIDFGTANYQATYNGGIAQGQLKAGGLDAAALFMLPLYSQVSVFGKAGIVTAKVQSSLVAGTPADLATGSASATVVRPLIGFGANFNLTEKADLRLDYDHVSGLGNSGTTGKMSVNMLSVGLAYRF